MGDRYDKILVVDLLGGIGDLLLVLPVVHGLARRNPGATLRVLTHEPGAELIRGDSAVAEVRTPRHGRAGAEREAVREVLAEQPPTLAVTTTRYDGIPELLAESGARCVTDLWRGPPPDEPVGERYLRILYDEGLLDGADLGRPPRVRLRPAELAGGRRVLAERLPAAAAAAAGAAGAAPPVVLVSEAGMAVKRWAGPRWHRLAALLSAQGHPLLTVGRLPIAAGLPLSLGSLRQLGAFFAAVGERGGVVVGADTGPVRLAAAVGARTVALFGPTAADRYGIGGPAGTGVDLQGLPECPYRQPTAITEQPCWWTAQCPLAAEPACMAELAPEAVAAAVAELS
ncbi:MAG TPA: glycosyltransferase family 9 protein [Micromonosporaceae bacterium]|nr:glycosyltransferase family 9 protein [Micromonosporaceae bacterium]